MNNVLLTGSTGSLGKFLIDDLLKSKVNIVLLIRAKSQPEAEDRVSAYRDSISSGEIRVLRCDLTDQKFGLNPQDYLDLTKNITHILHAAASTRFTLPIDEARVNNVDTTKRIIAFAKDCINLQRLGHISTAYVAGKRSGLILENEFEYDAGFLNTYQESKYEAEKIVRSELDNIPIVIFRPSLVITSTEGLSIFNRTGRNPASALMLGLFLAHKGFLPILPGKDSSKLDIIDGALASQSIIEIFLKDKLANNTYHITSANNAPSIKELIRLVAGTSDKKDVIRFCGDIDEFTSELKKIIRFRPDLSVVYKKTQSFLPELAFAKIFDNRNVIQELKLKSFSQNPIDILKPILK